MSGSATWSAAGDLQGLLTARDIRLAVVDLDAPEHGADAGSVEILLSHAAAGKSGVLFLTTARDKSLKRLPQVIPSEFVALAICPSEIPAFATILSARINRARASRVFGDAADSEPRAWPIQATWFPGCLRDENDGRINVRRVAKLYGISLRHLARCLNCTPGAFTFSETVPRFQKVLRQFEAIAQIVPRVGGVEAFRTWVRSIGQWGVAPLEMLERRRGSELVGLLATSEMNLCGPDDPYRMPQAKSAVEPNGDTDLPF